MPFSHSNGLIHGNLRRCDRVIGEKGEKGYTRAREADVEKRPPGADEEIDAETARLCRVAGLDSTSSKTLYAKRL